MVAPADVEPDDLVQEAMARALQSDLGAIENLEAYLRRTVLNLATNERRRWRRGVAALHRIVSDDSAAASSYVDAGDLLRLPPQTRAILWLTDVEGWPYAEVAELVGCSEEAARARASRARRQLRIAIAGEWS